MKKYSTLCPRFVLGNSLGITVILLALSHFLWCYEIPFATLEPKMSGDSVKESSPRVR